MIAWWNAMFASEYSSMCSAGVALRNSSNIVRRLAISSSDALSVASRAAMLSSAAHISIISMICFFVLRTMKMPRRGTVRRKPSCSSSVIASRIGVRDTPSACDSWRSSRRISSSCA